MIAYTQLKDSWESVDVCPFCGSFNTFVCKEDGEDWYFVDCEECGYKSCGDTDINIVIKKHNEISSGGMFEHFRRKLTDFDEDYVKMAFGFDSKLGRDWIELCGGKGNDVACFLKRFLSGYILHDLCEILYKGEIKWNMKSADIVHYIQNCIGNPFDESLLKIANFMRVNRMVYETTWNKKCKDVVYESDMYKNIDELVKNRFPNAEKLLQKCVNGKRIPDGVYKIDDEIIPVEVKRDNFASTGIYQLMKYIDDCGSSYGIAIARRFSSEPYPDNFICIQYKDLYFV